MRFAEKYHWHPDQILDRPIDRIWPFLVSPADKSRGRLIPLDKLPSGTREEVLNRTRARKNLPHVGPRGNL